MLTTSQLRSAWAPRCTGPFERIALHGEGVISVRASAASAFHALNALLAKHDYETRKEDTGAYNCRIITQGTEYSLHAYGIAADLNWSTNPYGDKLISDFPMDLIRDIEALRTNSGHVIFRWGGRYSGNKDAMHFEVVCTPAQLATGIKPFNTEKPVVVTEKPAVSVAPDEEDVMDLAGTPSWVKRQPNSRFPAFIGHFEKDTNSLAVLSRDNAAFDPPWQEGRKSASSEDGVAFGLWFRRFFNAGAFYGFDEVEGVFFAIAQNGTYDIAKK